MPFTGPSSYLPTIDEFRAHWTNVNLALAPNPLVLLGPYALADLDSDRDDLSDAITALVAGTNVLEGFRQDRDNLKPDVQERMRQLGQKIRGILAGSTQEGHIADLIDLNASQGKWLVAMRDAIDNWTQVNADPPAGFVGPLTLFGGYTLANFTADCTALETALQGVTQNEQFEEDLRKERDRIYLEVRDHLVTYRDAVEGSFPANHPLILSLPRISRFQLSIAQKEVLPGTEAIAEVVASDAELDAIRYRWEVRREAVNKGYAGQGEVRPGVVSGLLSGVSGNTVKFAAPRDPGAYRLYVVAADGKGGAACANLPFFVRAK